ncbi:MAG: PEGA domain-containing protein [Gallionella sp.]
MKNTAKTLALCSSLLLAAGCSSPGGMSNLFPSAGDNPIKVESNPAGAEVYLMGTNVGMTPLQLTREDVFPNLYPKDKESLYGRVTLRKAGCADFTATVSSQVSSYGLHAKLDCGGDKPAAAAGTSSGGSSETAEQRLGKIKDLLDKGLITEDEAKNARERILNGL